MARIDLNKLLDGREFIDVATCDLSGRPNAAPKFILKAAGRTLYLVDYTLGRTWRNITANPRVSLSFMDQRTLTGYQLNGAAAIISEGPSYERMCREMIDKEVRLTAKHIIDAVAGKSSREHFEAGITDRFIVLRVTVKEVILIGHRGDVVRGDDGEV